MSKYHDRTLKLLGLESRLEELSLRKRINQTTFPNEQLRFVLGSSEWGVTICFRRDKIYY